MKVHRYYLEINSIENLNTVKPPDKNLMIQKIDPPNIELNKFFYKNVGNQHRWVDRLVWDNFKWSNYLENKNVMTFILKLSDDLVGYCEVINDQSNQSTEIAYFGILKNFIGRKFGGYFLFEAIKKCFDLNSNRVWVHTCTLDHKHALKNYQSRGMRIFKEETININIV